VNDGDPPRLRPIWFFDELGQVIRVAGQQHDRAFHFKRSRGNDGIDRTPMTGLALYGEGIQQTYPRLT
jgi:hypothetical protein